MSKTIEINHLVESLGNALFHKRENYAWLASQVNTSPTQIHKLLKGKIKSPDLSLVNKICEVLELRYRDVLYKTALDFIPKGENFNVIIQRLMDETAINKIELANKTGFSKQYIYQAFSSGKASVKFFDKTASIFGLTYEQITGQAKIDLNSVSEFYFPKNIKSYNYPILNDKQIGFIYDIDLTDVISFNFKDTTEYLGENGYFYKVKNNNSTYFFLGQMLGIKYPDVPKSDSHILIYDTIKNKIHIIEFSEKRLFESTVFRGTITQIVM